MIQLTLWLTRKEFLNSYPTWIQFFGGLFSVAMSLLVYWFTATALEPAFTASPETRDLFYGDFFTYIVLGELIIAVPIHLLSSPASVVKQIIVDESLDLWLLAPGGLLRPLFANSVAMAIRDWLLVNLAVGVAAFVLNLNISLMNFIFIFLSQVLLFPLFFGLGLFGVAMTIAFGRGAGVLAQFGVILTIFAGVFFPIKALPEFLSQISYVGSPYTMYLESLRKHIAGLNGAFSPQVLISLLAWTLFSVLVGRYAVNLSLKHRRQKGDPIVLVPE
jgi:ABC-2 type transport system permease protein